MTTNLRNLWLCIPIIKINFIKNQQQDNNTPMSSLTSSSINVTNNNKETQYCSYENILSKFKSIQNFTTLHINISSIHANIEEKA